MKKGIKIIGKVLFQISVFLCLLLSFSLLWAKNNYGNIGFEEIVFHLNMPLEGTSEEFVQSYIKTALCPAVFLLFLELSVMYFPAKSMYSLVINGGNKKEWRWKLWPFRPPVFFWALFFAAWLGGLVYSADECFGIITYARNQIEQSNFIKEEYVDAKDVKIKFPEKKRNLICIYMESAETSSQDKANGGVFDENYIPEMTQLAKENVSFSHSKLLEGAVVAPACGWTIAALVAETAGLPLKLFEYNAASGGTDNSMGKYEAFMPGATSLGDILEKEGYHNYFLAGSKFKFGGRTSYFTQHGNYEIWDYVRAKEEGAIPQDYRVWWGFEDIKLYDFAKEKLLSLASGDKPFNFSMLTVDTHHQDGYVCERCPDKYDVQYSNVWACASAQVNEFVEWIKQQDFYENTTVVIVGDHCSMDSDYYAELSYDKHNGETVRKVYNTFINSPIQPIREKGRSFTTMDIFPTTLASLGVEIEGDRLGLGTNLFSEEQTLSEKYGYEKMFEELNKKSVFYDNEILYP